VLLLTDEDGVALKQAGLILLGSLYTAACSESTDIGAETF
jgi:hypothetical protein